MREKIITRIQDNRRRRMNNGKLTANSTKVNERKGTALKKEFAAVSEKEVNDHLYDMWEIRANNALFKELCIDCGLPAPEWYYMKENIDPEILGSLHYPVVVKPVEQCGEAGVSVCRNEEELLSGYNQAIGASESRQVVVEEYVEGMAFSAAVSVIRGRITDLDQELGGYTDAIRKMIRKTQLQNGTVILQGIKNDDGCFFIGFELTKRGAFSA